MYPRNEIRFFVFSVGLFCVQSFVVFSRVLFSRLIRFSQRSSISELT